MKHCIFYLPYKLEKDGKRARMVRPVKMIQAFQKNGYEVVCIDGYAVERKEKIRTLKQRIESGERFDFMYAEASTMPMLLNEPHHIPTHPFVDASLFFYLNKKSIPIGLFYPDIYWRFPNYGEELAPWKKKIGLLNYQLDMKFFNRTLKAFYLPHRTMEHYLDVFPVIRKMKELPPGADDISWKTNQIRCRDYSKNPLTVFYVGGIGHHYQIRELLEAIRNVENCRGVICCRQEEWDRESASLQSVLCDRIEIIHKSGNELEPYYQKADLGALLFQNMEYWAFAMPVKAFEYLAHELPMVATKKTAIGDFVEKHSIGWAIDNSSAEIQNLLEDLIAHPDKLQKKRERCSVVKRENTWTQRAKQVAEDLTHS